MLTELSAKQLVEWQAYDCIEPIGNEWRSDYRTALLCSTIINAIKQAVGGKGESVTPSDFLFDWDLEKPNHPKNQAQNQSVDQMRYVLRGMVQSRGGEVKKRDSEKHEQLKRELGLE